MMERGEIVVQHPAQFPGFKLGQVWQGCEGDTMWVAYDGEIVFYTTRGTRVDRVEADHVYAPLTLVFQGV